MRKSAFQILVPQGEKRVLVHACCAPCSAAILERLLQEGAEPIVFFSNSNITPFAEYSHRLGECLRYAESLGIPVVEDRYDHDAWLCGVSGLEREPERGARCLRCFTLRLERAAAYAASQGIRVLTTSLASSRWKDLAQVHAAGAAACAAYPDLIWWDQNWRKGGLQERRNALIREQGFYNQTFCGCEFSQSSRETGQ